MARDWHETFKRWAKPPSETEETKGKNVARMIKGALRDTDVLANGDFTAYPTGSYRNNTNIRLDSDVDVAVVYRRAFFWQIPPTMTPEQFGLGRTASYGLTDFRRDLGQALVEKFGSDVRAGNKTFKIKANTNRLPADATPFLPHRRYSGRKNSDGSWHYIDGVETRRADGARGRIVNWHDEHYESGVAKNDATGRRYKRVTRILKKLRNDMLERGSDAAKSAARPTPSFLLECLAYNAPDSCFGLSDGTYYDDVQAVIAAIWNVIKTENAAAELLEVSERKKLFSPAQGWTREQARAFLARAYEHVGFGT